MYPVNAFGEMGTIVGADDPFIVTQHYVRQTDLGKAWLKTQYPKLKKNYEWLRRTQRGELLFHDSGVVLNKEAYRWRGRTKQHCLTSGLDDYPRSPLPHLGELHVDLLSWVSIYAETMARIAGIIGNGEDGAGAASTTLPRYPDQPRR